MGMMMYMIIVDHQIDMSHHHNATAEDREKYHSAMFLEKQLLPGLSIMNLISFLFCIPVQVSYLPVCGLLMHFLCLSSLLTENMPRHTLWKISLYLVTILVLSVLNSLSVGGISTVKPIKLSSTGRPIWMCWLFWQQQSPSHIHWWFSWLPWWSERKWTPSPFLILHPCCLSSSRWAGGWSR